MDWRIDRSSGPGGVDLQAVVAACLASRPAAEGGAADGVTSGGAPPDAAESGATVAVEVGATALGFKVDLSGPVMLAPWVRLFFAALLALAMAAALYLMARLGKSGSAWAYAGTAAVVLAGIVGLIVFVMGYGKVEFAVDGKS